MLAHKQIVTVDDPDRLILTGLPFRRGQRVEIVMIAEEEEVVATGEELSRLFGETQKLPAAQDLTEEQIAEEIAAYRAGR